MIWKQKWNERHGKASDWDEGGKRLNHEKGIDNKKNWIDKQILVSIRDFQKFVREDQITGIKINIQTQ